MASEMNLSDIHNYDAPPLTTAQTNQLSNTYPKDSMAARASKLSKPDDKSMSEFEKTRLMEHVKMSFSNARTVNTIDLERFARYYRLFRNRQIQKNYRGLANLFVPEPYRVVHKKAAKLSNAIKRVKVDPQGPQDEEAAKGATHLLNFLRNKLNLPMTERVAIQESRIIGLSWLKCLWNQSKETQTEPWKGVDITMQTADRVFVSPGTTILDVFEGNVPWLVHEYYVSLEELKLNPNYKEEDLLLLSQRGGITQKPTPLSLSRIMNENRQMIALSQKIKKIQILEYWGKYNPKAQQSDDDGQSTDILCVVADGAIVLRAEENPYAKILPWKIPFVPVVANPVGQELYPVGDIEPAESLFNELNDTRNQRMDTVTLNVDPMKIILRGANIDEKELVARRGWIVHSNIPNGVQAVPPDMAGVNAAIQEEKIIRSDIAQATNTIDFTAGSEVEAGLSVDTARGAIIAKGESDVVSEDELNLLKTSLRMVYQMVLGYCQLFLDRPFVIRAMEKGQQQFFSIDSMSIQGNLDLDIEMQTLQDKTTEQQLKLMLMNLAMKIPGSNIGRFWTDVLEAFNENVNVDEYYQEPPPAGPEAPKVSIALKGDLSSIESDAVFKTIPGIDQSAADPMFREDLRSQMRGQLPEKVEHSKNEMDLMHSQVDLLKKLQPNDAADESAQGTQ